MFDIGPRAGSAAGGNAAMLRLQEEAAKLKADVDALELERNFYFNKVPLAATMITWKLLLIPSISFATSKFWYSNN